MDNGYIRTRRETLRIGMCELADKVGMSDTYLSFIENNKIRPSDKILKKLCDALDLDYFDSCRKSKVFPQELKDEFFNQTKERAE